MKVLNVFGIILAWILSIAMVLMLIVAPLSLSALTVLEPKAILEAVGDGLLKTAKSAAQSRETYSVQVLAAEIDLQEDITLDLEDIPVEEVLDGVQDYVEDAIGQGGDLESILGEGINIEDIFGENPDLQAIFGEAIDPVVLENFLGNLLNSNLVADIVEIYVENVTNVLSGKPVEELVTADTVVEVMESNLDEVVEMLEDAGQELSKEEKEVVKTEIRKAVTENAEMIAQEIIKAIPSPNELIESNEDLKAVIAVLAKRNQIKWTIVGIIVVLALLIFALRCPGFRGLRWLSTNLFIAGAFNVVICLALGAGTAVIIGLVEGLSAGSPISVDGIVSKLLSQLTTGVIVRSVFIIVAAIVLLVGYILLKKFVVNRKAAWAEPVAAEMPEEAPSFVPQAAPVYDSVTITPELNDDPAPEEKPAE